MRAIESLERRLRANLVQMDEDGLRRSLRLPAGIDLCSNDYLGLAAHPLLKQRMAAAVCQEGCGSTGSRLLRGERDCFSALERRFAHFKSAQRALYFSSGYMANLAVLATFAEAGDIIFSDQRNHASLIDGARLSQARRVIFPHNHTGELARLLRQEQGPGQKFVVVESLFSMDGDRAPLAEYAALCRDTNTALIVDEAHAVGIYGAQGSGLIEACGVSEDVFLSINTAGKALGVAGAFVAGPEWAIETLVQRARPFVFSTAPPPSLAAALEASLELMEAEPQRRSLLLARAAYLGERLASIGLEAPSPISQIMPIVLGSNERAMAVAAVLQREGFDVRAIRPPTVPRGTARLRISINIDLSEDTLDRFTAALDQALHLSTCAAFS